MLHFLIKSSLHFLLKKRQVFSPVPAQRDGTKEPQSCLTIGKIYLLRIFSAIKSSQSFSRFLPDSISTGAFPFLLPLSNVR